MNANLIFNWLKDPRFKPDATGGEETLFFPVEVSDADMAVEPSLLDDRPAGRIGGRVEIALANGHRLTIDGAFDGDALSRLLKGLVA